MAPRTPEITVIGGGVGGLVAVRALLDAGLRVECFERSLSPSEIGAGIQVGPNATRILQRLGAIPALEKVASQPQTLEVRRWKSGAPIRQLSLSPQIAQRYGAPYCTVNRADLHQVLAECVGVQSIRYGMQCEGVREVRDKVELRFADGSEHIADAVIGADGINSSLRAAIAPQRPTFAGKAAWRVQVPSSAVEDLAHPPTLRMWLGPGIHAVSYPIEAGKHLSFAASIACQAPHDANWEREGPIKEFVSHFTDWDPDIRRILDHAPSALRLPLYDHPDMSATGKGRLTLIGDAAHPMLPFFAQGAAQAIEDAWALSLVLTGATIEDLPQRLRAFETSRAKRTFEVQRRSQRNGTLFQLPDGLRQIARDFVLSRMELKQFDWLYGYDVASSVRRI